MFHVTQQLKMMKSATHQFILAHMSSTQAETSIIMEADSEHISEWLMNRSIQMTLLSYQKLDLLSEICIITGIY